MAKTFGSFKKYTFVHGTGANAKTCQLWFRPLVFDVGTIITNLTATNDLVDEATVPRNVKALTRHRYPGAPGVSVKATTREVIVGPPATRSVLPGYPVTIELPASGAPYVFGGANGKMKSHQFTFVGPFTQLYKYAEQHNTKAFLLRSPWGETRHISHSAGG